MCSETNLNVELIAQDCGLFGCENSDVVIQKIKFLKSRYADNELVKIYNYMLTVAKTPEILEYIVIQTDCYRSKSSLEYLVDLLLVKNAELSDEETKEKYNHVRILTAKAISNLKSTDAVSSLLYCLNNKNENYRVRLACADALGKIGDRFAVAPLIDVAKDETEKSVYLREGAVFALGLLGDTRAIDPLVNILETKQGIMNKFTFLKERAIEALSKMGIGNNERVFKAMKSSLSDESTQVRINAIEAIMDSENPQAYDIIKNCLENDSDFEVQKNALIALYNLSDREILDEVINSQKYSQELKAEAKSIIEEYEND